MLAGGEEEEEGEEDEEEGWPRRIKTVDEIDLNAYTGRWFQVRREERGGLPSVSVSDSDYGGAGVSCCCCRSGVLQRAGGQHVRAQRVLRDGRLPADRAGHRHLRAQRAEHGTHTLLTPSLRYYPWPASQPAGTTSIGPPRTAFTIRPGPDDPLPPSLPVCLSEPRALPRAPSARSRAAPSPPTPPSPHSSPSSSTKCHSQVPTSSPIAPPLPSSLRHEHLTPAVLPPSLPR